MATSAAVLPVIAPTRPAFGFDPAQMARETRPFYIGANATDQAAMLQAIGCGSLQELFGHLPAGIRFEGPLAVPGVLGYDAIADLMFEVSQQNHTPDVSFLGDGLPQYQVPDLVPLVCGLRGLTTTYTSYQPEVGQGTLQGLWIYQCLMSMLTGFEAVNASLYDRATALFEACNTARRLMSKGSTTRNTILVAGSLYPGDLEVVETLARDTGMVIRRVPIDPTTGVIDPATVREMAAAAGGDLAAIAFPQTNSLGCLEDVHALTDLADELGVKSIAVVDPMQLATGGLVPPAEFGSRKQGTTMFVGEGQHLALGPNFGGPGVGIFGIRFNEQDRLSIRQTPGRFVGQSLDIEGQEALLLVASTREQHIRRQKATSNICSNQAFVALAVGAAILARGETGMTAACRKGYENAHRMAERLSLIEGVRLQFADTPFFNEFVVQVDRDVNQLIEQARQQGIHLGVNVSRRVGDEGNHSLLLSFGDLHTDADLDRLERFLVDGSARFSSESLREPASIPTRFMREGAVGLPQIPEAELQAYYGALNALNVSPDDSVFPLGSCTMKYNPWLNDWAASLAGFVQAHSEAPVEDVQGSLRVLYEIEQWFKGITGLAGVTTQPVAGAQGELTALKMFQAYHRDHSSGEPRDTILIPHSAHGTNPATAAMAGYQIVEIDADATGKMKMEHVRDLIREHGPRIAGIMVTNPNTSGVFETEFKEMADQIHEAGGLVFMDGANMNAIAGQVNLGAMGVDAVHNNLHKTWSIPHGGGGPGDGMVAVSEKLLPYLPGHQIELGTDGIYRPVKAPQSIGSIHRHWGNFAHKVRALTYLRALGHEGIPQMSAVAVLSARYLYEKLSQVYRTIPVKSDDNPIMHEFILTLDPGLFARIQEVTKLGRPAIIARIGKLFLDFGLHAPTVAFPAAEGLMIEPTESFTQAELDRFAEVVLAIHKLISEHPGVLISAPHFTPVRRVDDVAANRNLVVSERLTGLPRIPTQPLHLAPSQLHQTPVDEIAARIVAAAQQPVGD